MNFARRKTRKFIEEGRHIGIKMFFILKTQTPAYGFAIKCQDRKMNQIKVELQETMGLDRSICEAAWTSSTLYQGKKKKTIGGNEKESQ